MGEGHPGMVLEEVCRGHGLESQEPCWVAQLIGASSHARRVLDLMPHQGTSWKQQIDVSLSHISLSPPCLSLKAMHISSCEDKRKKQGVDHAVGWPVQRP